MLCVPYLATRYAIDRNAPVVSNDRFRDHAANGETLGAEGTEACRVWPSRRQTVAYIAVVSVRLIFYAFHGYNVLDATQVRTSQCSRISRALDARNQPVLVTSVLHRVE